jgi:hypothetical protein
VMRGSSQAFMVTPIVILRRERSEPRRMAKHYIVALRGSPQERLAPQRV